MEFKNILSIISLIVSSIVAVLVVYLNNKSNIKLKQLEQQIKKADIYLSRLLKFRDELITPINDMNGDMHRMIYVMENKPIESNVFNELIDKISKRIASIEKAYKQNKFLFTNCENDELQVLIEIYQDSASNQNVAKTFLGASNFHDCLLETIDKKLMSEEK